jgi:hypothetical protein
MVDKSNKFIKEKTPAISVRFFINEFQEGYRGFFTPLPSVGQATRSNHCREHQREKFHVVVHTSRRILLQSETPSHDLRLAFPILNIDKKISSWYSRLPIARIGNSVIDDQLLIFKERLFYNTYTYDKYFLLQRYIIIFNI